jgi:molecular chaperone GrpE (heat shock protein)
METNKFENLKVNVQEIIDTIAAKNFNTANNKLLEVSEELDDLLDLSDDENDLMEISRYQVLLNQLQRKIISK